MDWFGRECGLLSDAKESACRYEHPALRARGGCSAREGKTELPKARPWLHVLVGFVELLALRLQGEPHLHLRVIC